MAVNVRLEGNKQLRLFCLLLFRLTFNIIVGNNKKRSAIMGGSNKQTGRSLLVSGSDGGLFGLVWSQWLLSLRKLKK